MLRFEVDEFLCQYLVRPLVILLMSDIRQTYAGLSDTPPPSAPDRSDHTVASQFKRKRWVSL